MGALRKLASSIIPRKHKTPILQSIKKTLRKGLIKLSGGEDEAIFWMNAQRELTVYNILQGFLQGTIPIPEVSNNKVFSWFDPDPRGIIPVTDFKIRNDLLRCLKKDKLKEIDKQFEVKINANFEQTLQNCSKPRGQKTSTWITPEYTKVMLELHEMGIAHSVETYQEGKLVGGVIGIALNGYFVTLTLFRTVDNASKVAFTYLLKKLKEDGFKLHLSGTADSWFTQFGAINIAKENFKTELIEALTSPVQFSTTIPKLEL